MTDLQTIAAALGAEPTQVFGVTVPGNPIPKGRPRFAGHAYTPASTQAAEDALGWSLKVGRPPKMTGQVVIVAAFYRQNRVRTDVDNLMKLVMDAATAAGLWIDDSQVTAQAAFIGIDDTHPRTEIVWAQRIAS